MKFNDDQQQAIESDNHSLIISAAAGSGKTTVLIEKIMKLIRQDGHSVREMLIITFTREAAAHMRQKLKEKLEKEAVMTMNMAVAQALTEVDSAQISTIHSFCSTLLRENFQLVNIDPMYRISEGNETKPLFEQAFHEALVESIDDKNESKIKETIIELMEIYNQKNLQEMVETIYHRLMGIPDPFQTARENNARIGQAGEDNPWVSEIMACVGLELLCADEYRSRMEYLFQKPEALDQFREIHEKDLALLGTLTDSQNPEKIIREIQWISDHWQRTVKPRNCTPQEAEWYALFKAARDQIQAGKKGVLQDVLERLEDLSKEEQIRANEHIQLQNEALIALTEITANHYMEMKRQIHVLDFEDLEQLTYLILTGKQFSEYRKDIQAKYKDIFVDECQDISAIQDAIIQNLHGEGNRLTMVGDVKQSIYRFRHADPSLFLQYRETYEDRAEALRRRIFFRSNYRSARPVIEAVNQVFSGCMDSQVNELDYSENDYLVYGGLKTSEEPVEIHLVSQEKGKDRTEAQCVVIARRIGELLKQTILDENGKERPVTYRDMTILMRSAKDKGPVVAEYLKKLHIPVYYEGGETYFSLSEIIVVLSIMQAIDNYKQDIPLIASLRSVAFQFSDEELSQIRKTHPEHIPFYEAFDACQKEMNTLGNKCRKAAETLNHWKFLSQVMNLSDFVWYIIRMSSIYAYCGSFTDGEIRQANLRLLAEKAKTFEENTNGTFSDYMASLGDVTQGREETHDSDAVSYLSDNDDVIRLMTMHKSKGLEYPVVFLMGVETRLVKHISKNPLMTDIGQMHAGQTHLGMYLPKVSAKRRTVMHTFGKAAFELRTRRNELAEQARLLYVAMTRAMDLLIIVGEDAGHQESLWRSTVKPYRIWNSKTMLDMIMPAYYAHQESGSWKLIVHEAEEIPQEEEDERQQDAISRMLESLHGGKIPQELLKEKEKEPFEPAKTTVTSLSTAYLMEKRLPESVTEEDIDLKRSAQGVVPIMLSKEPEKPAFMEKNKTTGAEIGTQTHRFLSLIDLNGLAAGRPVMEWIRREKKRMLDAGIFTLSDMKKINEEKVVAFFSSDLGVRMVMSEHVVREWSFNVCVNEEKGTIMQGIIDAIFFENDHWILVDYKTEYVQNVEEFIARHMPQLNLYRYAVEKLTSLPVEELWLYSTYQGKAYPVPKTDILV